MTHEGTFEIPAEWKTAEWKLVETSFVGDLQGGGKLIGVDGMLQDGSVFVGLTYPGGNRVARVSPCNGWAIEERFMGRPPRRRLLSTIQRVWGIQIQVLVEAVQKAERECGGRPT